MDEPDKTNFTDTEGYDRLRGDRFTLPYLVCAGSFAGQTTNGVFAPVSGKGVRHIQRFLTGQYRIYFQAPTNHTNYLVLINSNDINVSVVQKTREFFSIVDSAVIGSGLDAQGVTSIAAESDVRYDFIVFAVPEISPINAFDFTTSTSTTTTTTTSTSTTTTTTVT